MIVNDVKHLALAAVGVLIFAGCGKKAATPPPPPRPVTVAAAETRDVPLYLDEIGTCSAYETVMIRPQVSGPITEIHFTDGQEIAKGDPLFTINPLPYQTALDRAKATLEQNRAKLDFARSQLERSLELQKTKVIASQELDSARSAADAAQAQVHEDEAAVKSAQISLGYCVIRTPIAGRTSKRMVDLGNLVVASSTDLLLIQRQDPIYADFSIPEKNLPRVREFIDAGTLRVEASFPDEPEKSRFGEFNFLDSGVQAGAGTVKMRALLPNEDRLFWPGQFVNVRILLDTLKGAVLVPSEAMQVGNAGPFVFVVKADSTVDMRAVRPGQRQQDAMVISDGLKAGEKVVVTGQMTLAPGAHVRVVEAAEPAAAQKVTAR